MASPCLAQSRRLNKLKYVILGPFRTMSKAKDIYFKGMEDLAGRVSRGRGLGWPVAAQVPTVLRSFSKGREDDEDYWELLRLVSERNTERKPTVRAVAPNGMGVRSSSTGIGKIGRIDEDKPCEFGEVIPSVGPLYPRSRSHSIGRRKFMFY